MAPAQAQKVLKMQATWPASRTLFENFTMFARRVEELTDGQVKIEIMPAGRAISAFEVLEATHRKVIDGAHTWAGYWQGKNSAAILFTGGPGGPWGMDHQDFLGWMWWGGGQQLVEEFYREHLKLNVVSIPVLISSPQALGWFKKRIETLADFKGMKCRQTGVAGRIFNEMGMRTVNIPGDEIMPAAERGTIDCAEWIGGVEDLRFGFQTIWKFHYAPSLHESVSIGDVLINGDVWKDLGRQHQEIIRAAATEVLIKWWVGWQKQNADAVRELQEKHKVHVLQTPNEIHTEFLKAWDRVAAREAERNPFFKKVMDHQKAWASSVVPAKRLYFPAYRIAADHYWPEK
ncbi:TRAP transporter substrate-binding protein [Reyranella sp. CPCC 100927]|uniref:TRAP transporter substrate-binding protein n=1 Tax=Reyranella sp. CPCC 100927 TaxID=2599616 RepID=UPI0015B3A433|nr:TRAP transporter substrate-binding protein [Reyranella sp. CPCC 100927]